MAIGRDRPTFAATSVTRGRGAQTALAHLPLDRSGSRVRWATAWNSSRSAPFGLVLPAAAPATQNGSRSDAVSKCVRSNAFVSCRTSHMGWVSEALHVQSESRERAPLARIAARASESRGQHCRAETRHNNRADLISGLARHMKTMMLIGFSGLEARCARVENPRTLRSPNSTRSPGPGQPLRQLLRSNRRLASPAPCRSDGTRRKRVPPSACRKAQSRSPRPAVPDRTRRSLRLQAIML